MMDACKIISACLIVTVALANVAAANLLEPTIGRSFFLPNEDIGSPLRGGRMILKDLGASCYLSSGGDRLTHDSRSSYESLEKFYNSLTTETGIAADLKGKYTMGATLDTKTAHISKGSVEIKGTSLNVYTIVNTTYVKPECFKGSQTQLADDMVNQLDYLPLEISSPDVPSSWNQYHTFLQTYGSHFVSHVYYGASIKQWTFSKKEDNYSERQLQVKACADFQGPTKAGEVGVQVCSDVSQQEINEVSNLHMSSNLEIFGGSDATRHELRDQRSEELINKLLNEGREMQTPVKYKFTAIWDILKQKFFDNSERRAKAINMEQYFKGYLDFGCTTIKGGDMKLRWFRRSEYYSTANPDFECMLEKEGCHHNDDCTVGGAGTVTYCYGKSCVEYTSPPAGSKAMGAKIRYNKTGSYNAGVNKSCYYSWARGKCHGDWSRNKLIWPASRAKRAFTEKIRATRSGKYFGQ